ESGISFDLDGRPRPLGHAPDIGAYESGMVTPIISLSSTDYRVTENQNALITLTLDSAYTDTVTVDFITADVSATSGSDYVPISQTIVFTASVTSQTVTIPIIDDLLVENDEALQITLSNPENGRLLGISEALVTIQDNDTPPPAPLPTLNFDAENYATTEGETSVLITFTLDITSSEAVSVQLTTIDLSAVAGADYTAVSETVVFPAGTTVQTVTIPILDDTAVEGAETFEVVLANPQNGVLGLNSTTVVTILDDDPLEPPEFVLYLPLVITK
ncbi:MAG: hypothetical protein KDE51_09555, partial [Anaerolineales bacterium]|nr:hypothetical protein [Anaerolineales bacterium]